MSQLSCALRIAVCFIGGSHAIAQPIEWLSPVDGDWHDAANWSGANVPSTTGEDVSLGFMSPYVVTSGADSIHGALTISNPSATLVITDAADHTLGGDVLNHGLISIDVGSIGSPFDFRFDGSGQLVLNEVGGVNVARLLVGNTMVTNGPAHTISGSGEIQPLNGVFHNEGLVVANVVGAIGLELDNEITQSMSGRMGADGGNLLLKDGVSITGGELFTLNNGSIRIDGPYNLNGIEATISGVQITGRVDILDSYNRLLVNGSIQNNGEIVINSELDANEPEVRIVSDSSILGNGEIVMHSNTTFASYLTTEAGATCTIGVNMTVRGTGIIDGNQVGGIGGFVNNGAIIADDPDYLLLLTGDHTGSGLFGATDGSVLGLGEFADMVDCHFNTLGDGYISIYYAPVDLIGGTNDGQFIVSGSGELRISGTFTNNGSIATDINTSFPEDIQFLGDTTIIGDGEFVVDNAFGGFFGSNTSTVTFGPDQRIEGRAEFDGVFVVEGLLAPRGDFEILDELSLTSSSRVDMIVGNDSAPNDSELYVDIDALLNLSGELSVQFVDTYTPMVGDSFRLITGIPGTEVLGAFDTITLPPPPQGLLYEINEESFGIYLDIVEDTSVCQADLTGDGVLNFFDVSAFLSAYNAMDPIADFDGNGSYNFFDVSAFLGAFSAGCL